MPLPPSEEGLNIPAQFVNLGDLFGSEIKSTGGNPVGLARNRITDKAHRGTGLVHVLLAKQHPGVVEDNTAGRYRKRLKAGLDGVLLDATDKVLARTAWS